MRTTVASRGQTAVPAEVRPIVLHPDRGFALSVQNPMDPDEAYRKLKALTGAAVWLRQRGVPG